MKYLEYPEKEAVLIVGNCSVVRQSSLDHLCGYCRLPGLVAEPGYRGILTYVPVHGGITYAKLCESTGQMVYGFDCAHSGDETSQWWHDSQAVLEEAQKMSIGIQVAALFEPLYLLVENNRVKAEIIDLYHRVLRLWGIEFEARDNLGAMLNLLCSKL